MWDGGLQARGGGSAGVVDGTQCLKREGWKVRGGERRVGSVRSGGGG